jgi:hypothetical protein
MLIRADAQERRSAASKSMHGRIEAMDQSDDAMGQVATPNEPRDQRLERGRTFRREEQVDFQTRVDNEDHVPIRGELDVREVD